MKKAVLSLALAFMFVAAPALAEEHVLRVAISSMLSPKETFVEYRRLVEYLGKKTGRMAVLVQRKGYAETDGLLKDRAVDLAFICSGPYVRDHDLFGVELLAAPVVGGKTTYRSYIIVKKGSPFHSLRELKGRAFAFTDESSNSGCWLPRHMLSLQGFDPDTFFEKTIYTHGHDNSVEAVSRGLVAGAGVDSLIFDYMKSKGYPAAQNVTVVEQSPPHAIPPVVVPKGVDPALKAAAQKALLEMHKDPEGKVILDRLMMDRFMVPSDKDYDTIRDVMKGKRGRK